MKKIIFAAAAFLLLQFTLSAYADDITDNSYKFRITLPSDWAKSKTEETSKKDAISYSFDKKDGKNAIMILAFKVTSVKNLDDFIYTLEKDMTLNIPAKSGGYTDFDNGKFDGRMAVYKDSEFVETIYYFRTKNDDGSDNYAYMVRFITAASFYDQAAKSEIKRIADSFTTL